MATHSCFPVPLDGSVNFCWDGKWYTMRREDSNWLEKYYRDMGGTHPHGPTHAKKIVIMETELCWITQEFDGIIHCAIYPIDQEGK